jgi:hypothetical protein
MPTGKTVSADSTKTRGEEWVTKENFLKYLLRPIDYTDREREEDLKKAGFKKEEIKFFVELGKKNPMLMTEETFVPLCKAYKAGVPESDLMDLAWIMWSSDFPRGIQRLVAESPEFAVKLSKVTRDLNDDIKSRLGKYPEPRITIMEMINWKRNADSHNLTIVGNIFSNYPWNIKDAFDSLLGRVRQLDPEFSRISPDTNPVVKLAGSCDRIGTLVDETLRKYGIEDTVRTAIGIEKMVPAKTNL